MFGFGKKWIRSIGNGQVSNVSACSDAAFAQKMIGDGYVFYPQDDAVYAPISGTIQTIFDTKHAIVIKGNDGVEVLIHIGLDTVKMTGDWISLKINVGDQVTEGTLLAKVNYQNVLDAGFKTEIPVLILNPDQFSVQDINEGEVNKDTKVLHYK